jgi:hypothetical protein
VGEPGPRQQARVCEPAPRPRAPARGDGLLGVGGGAYGNTHQGLAAVLVGEKVHQLAGESAECTAQENILGIDSSGGIYSAMKLIPHKHRFLLYENF